MMKTNDLKVKNSGLIKVPLRLNPEAGWLTVVQGQEDVPFAISRVYWIGGMPTGAERGAHAHKKIKQVLFCLAGHCDVKLDDGVSQEVVRLDDPSQGVLLGPGLWHEMFNFSPDCRLLVLADAPYDEDDYIRDYDSFRSWLKQ